MARSWLRSLPRITESLARLQFYSHNMLPHQGIRDKLNLQIHPKNGKLLGQGGLVFAVRGQPRLGHHEVSEEQRHGAVLDEGLLRIARQLREEERVEQRRRSRGHLGDPG